MSNCSVKEHAAVSVPRSQISVNGAQIPHTLISREVQHHPAPSPTAGWKQAATALVIKELLLQEARRLQIVAKPIDDGQGRRETEDEAMMRALVDQEVAIPEPDLPTCRRYYDTHRDRFRSSDIVEASHILFAAHRDDAETYAQAREKAVCVLAALDQRVASFAALASEHSDCPSRTVGGNIGQVTRGQTTPEFEQAIFAMSEGQTSTAPVATRYGFHIIRIERKIDGQILPFEHIAPRIADYLKETVHSRATAQYVARLVSRADIKGIEIADAQAMRVY